MRIYEEEKKCEIKKNIIRWVDKFKYTSIAGSIFDPPLKKHGQFHGH
jgi:hypothetical protein